MYDLRYMEALIWEAMCNEVKPQLRYYNSSVNLQLRQGKRLNAVNLKAENSVRALGIKTRTNLAQHQRPVAAQLASKSSYPCIYVPH